MKKTGKKEENLHEAIISKEAKKEDNPSNKVQEIPLKQKIGKIKEFLTTNRRKIVKIFLLTVFCIALLVIIYFSYINLRFSIKEDLLITVPERHIDMFIDKDTPAEITISSSIQTSRLCTAYCTEKLISVNSYEVLYEKEFEFRRFHKLDFKQSFYPLISGEGQDIYTYSITCTNIQTTNCPVKDALVEKDIIISLTRTLTSEEKELKEEQEELLNYAFMVLNNGSFQTDFAREMITSMKYAKTSDLQNNLNDVIKERNKFSQVLDSSTDIWLTYNHTYIEDELRNKNLPLSIKNFSASSLNIYQSSQLRISNHNYAVNRSFMLAEKVANSENALEHSRQFLGNNLIMLKSEVADANSLVNFTARKIETKDFASYQDLTVVLDSAEISINLFENEYSEIMQNNTLFTTAQLNTLIQKEDACNILGSLNAYNNISNITSAPTNYCNKSQQSNLSSNLINYSNQSYEYISSNVESFCNEYSKIQDIKIEINKLQTQINNNISPQLQELIDSETAKHQINTLILKRNEISLRTDFSASLAKNIIDSEIRNLELENNISREQLNSSSLYDELLYLFEPITLDETTFPECLLKIESSRLNLSYEEYPVIKLDENSEEYHKSLPPLLPRACFDGKCEPYINDESQNYPLIIVHGHGFYSKNTRITPSQVHNELQSQLFEDRLYVPAGILRANDEIIENSLGNINAPIVYKATYYPEEILNNESINLFAKRLHNIIERAKEETGKDKVAILSHSMGGLVTRAYLEKYGTEDVEFIIIGGTPNYGVTTDTVALCKLFGRNLECDEMLENSEFLSKLKNEPDYDIPIYTLRGEGCSTFGADGDGVVQSDKVPLPYAKNYAFKGTCSATGAFHVNLLSPVHNPAIYAKIKEIILEHR